MSAPETFPGGAPSSTRPSQAADLTSAAGSGLGVSLPLYAALALLAILSARAIAPALPGSATGIALLIGGAGFVAACASQLVAAGGVVLCLRLLGNLLLLPELGVAFRMTVVPIGLCVIALVVAAAAQPLEISLSQALSILEILAPVCAAPLLLSQQRTRAVGLVFLLAAAGTALDVVAYEAARQAIGDPLAAPAGRGAARIGIALDAAAALLAFVWIAQRARTRAIGVAAVIAGACLVAFLARAGEGHTATSLQVILHRSLEGLARRSVALPPSIVSRALGLLPFAFAAVLLASVRSGRSPDLRIALTLCLLGRSGTGAPAAALLGVGAVLLAVPATVHAKPERTRPKATT